MQRPIYDMKTILLLLQRALSFNFDLYCKGPVFNFVASNAWKFLKQFDGEFVQDSVCEDCNALTLDQIFDSFCILILSRIGIHKTKNQQADRPNNKP